MKCIPHLMMAIGLLCLLSCSEDPVKKGGRQSKEVDTASALDLTMSGEELFIKHCKLCHGVDGSLGLNGAKDLRYTELNMEERIALITKGKNAMTPYERILSPSEIEKVAAYTATLKVD